jgi:MipA family protein
MGKKSILRNPRWILGVMALSLLCRPVLAAEDRLPLWEAGFGAAYISFPEFRGAKSQQDYVLPLPYLIYRGDHFQVDRGGARGVLIAGPRFDVDVSISGAIPVKSREAGVRSGMPDLDPQVEGGVSLNWLLWQGNGGRLRMRLPVRAAIATDLRSFAHAGWKADPQLHAETAQVPGRWSLSIAAGPLFADRRNHDYYYSVGPEYALPERPAYQARAGFSGWALVASASRRFERVWVGAFMRQDYLAGATFSDSPLVETRHSTMLGIGAAWVFRQSARQARYEW